MTPQLTGGFDTFVEQVVPILRARGLFRTEYTGTTLRDHFGLTRPASQYSAPVPVRPGHHRVASLSSAMSREEPVPR